jgi:hypothetical protein
MIYGLLKIPYSEVQVSKRDFIEIDTKFSMHIELIGSAFLDGYHSQLKNTNINNLINDIVLNINNEFLGFAFEGAAMSARILDFINPLSSRNNINKLFNSFMGNKHEYLLYVGIGWAIARLPFKKKIMSKYKVFLYPLIIDGIGFHQGYFYTKKTTNSQYVPEYISQHDQAAFDQGVGRSLWFSQGGNAWQIAKVINKFHWTRQGDLWMGVGLASTYAGGNNRSISELCCLSKNYRSNLALGSSFAAKARFRASNITKESEYACSIYCNSSIEEAADITDFYLSKSQDTHYYNWQNKLIKYFKN